MIQTKLVGGLGNQLFQLACARNLQKLYGHSLYYDDHIEISNRKRDVYRFPRIKFTDPQYIKDNYSIKNRITNLIHIMDDFDYCKFKTINFLDIESIYYLNGYWQGEKYFNEIANEFKEELKPTEETLEKIKQTIVDDSLSLHVRRTDYLNIQDYHPVQTIAYYESAVELLRHNGNVYVFSDDIEWCQQNFKFDKMHFIHNNDPLLDLWMMSACEKNVIANSTFSWWAAWLNNHPNKRVVCPKNWFGPKAPYSDKDILDNDWIKL